jgi:acetoin utilization deacetylase AcuC-like enzyme
VPVQKGSEVDDWLSLPAHIVIPAAEPFDPDLVGISAGLAEDGYLSRHWRL